MALDLNDKTANANNLTNNSATEYTADTPFAASTITAAVTIAGKENLTAADSASLSITANITLMCWVKFTALSTLQMIMTKWNNIGGDNRSYTFYIDTSNNLSFSYSNDGVAQDTISVAWTPSTETWYNIAISWTAATKVGQFAVNGVQQGTDQTGATITSLFDSTIKFQISGKDEANMNSPFGGKIDEVRVYNTARTIAAISGDYNVELVGDETGLVAYWPFEPLGGGGANWPIMTGKKFWGSR